MQASLSVCDFIIDPKSNFKFAVDIFNFMFYWFYLKMIIIMDFFPNSIITKLHIVRIFLQLDNTMTTLPSSVSVQHSRNPWLHRTGDIPTQGVHWNVWLLEFRGHYVRDVDWISPILFREPPRHIPQSNDVEGEPDIPSGDPDLQQRSLPYLKACLQRRRAAG